MDSVDRPSSSTLDEVLGVFDQLDDPCAPLTATEVSERVGCTSRKASETLDGLVEQGSLKTRTPGTGNRVWWRPATARRAFDREGRTPSESASLGAFVRAVEEYAIFTLDPDGRVTSWNEGAERIKGYGREEILGEHFSTFYTEADRERGVPDRNLERAASRGRYEDEGWRVCKDGSEFWANVVLTAIRDDDGTLLGFTKVTRDMTDYREHEREHAQTEEILKTSPVAISVQDSDGETVLANRRAQELLDLSEEEIIGEPENVDHWNVYDADGEPLDPEETPPARVLRTGEPVHDEVIAIDPPDGERMWFSVNAAPVFGPDGAMERVVTAGEDVTRLKTQARRIERQRDELEHQLTEVFDRVTDALFGLDEEWRITHANTRAEEVLGRVETGIVGEVVWEASPEIEAILDRETLREAMETGETLTYERYFASDSAWFEIRIYPSETGVSVYFTDVTERKRAEEALVRSEERLRLALDAGELGAWELDLQSGDALTRSPQHDRVFGYEEPLEEWSFERFLEHVHPADRERIERSFETALDEGDWTFECRIVRPDDEVRWIKAHAVFFYDDDEPARAIGVVQDLTDRKQHELELERYRRIVETIDDGIYVVDEGGRFTMVNDAYAEMTGYSREELLGTPASRVVEEETVETARRIQEELVAGERDTARVEADVRTATGGTVRAEATFAILHGEDSRYERVGVVRDVGDRVERERELERYETIIETVDDGIYVLDADDRFEMVNGGFVSMTDRSSDSLLGSHASIVFGDKFVDIAKEKQAELEDGDRSVAVVEEEIYPATGDPYVVESRFTLFELDDGRTGRVGVVRDITERKEYERELETRVRQQQVVTELGRRALKDPRLEVLFAEAVEAVADTLDSEYCKVLELLPDEQELLLRAGVGWKDGYVGEATVGTEVDSQAGYTLVSGEPVFVDDLATEDRFDGPELLVEHGVVSGISTVIGSFDDPWGVLGTHDTTRREFTQQDVNFVQAVANILTNAIERDRYERRLTSTIEELKESNDRLEQFAYIASHDLQEPLRMISNYLQLLEDRYRDALDDDAEEFIDFAVDGADRMREMIDDLLAYSRVGRHADPLEPTDAEAVVTRVLDSLQMQIEELDADVTVEPLPTVVSDERLLEQLFQNLVSNALKYHGDEPPRIEVGATRQGEEWLFRVTDNGIGIDPEYTDRIFEVFKRLHTREEFPGTGIGLTLCKRIVDRHGGEIWVDSEPGEGSTFYFTLPSEERDV